MSTVNRPTSQKNPHKTWNIPGIILGIGSSNERMRYVTPSLIGRAHTQNDLYMCSSSYSLCFPVCPAFDSTSCAACHSETQGMVWVAADGECNCKYIWFTLDIPWYLSFKELKKTPRSSPERFVIWVPSLKKVWAPFLSYCVEYRVIFERDIYVYIYIYAQYIYYWMLISKTGLDSIAMRCRIPWSMGIFTLLTFTENPDMALTTCQITDP